MAIARSRNATSSSAVRQIADFERRERLAQRLLDEDAPAERLDRLEGAEHLRPVLIAPDRRRVGGAVRAARGARLAPAEATRSSCAGGRG